MGRHLTQVTAFAAICHMRKMNFTPKTIINVGVGSCPELKIWMKNIPNVARIGIDIRGQVKWNRNFYYSLVGSVNQRVSFCTVCNSTRCNNNDHMNRIIEYPMKTLDSIVDEVKCKPPFFIWMDIEGGELEALYGATETIKNTYLINIEINNFPWGKNPINYKDLLHNFIVSSGFSLVDVEMIRSLDISDKLYQRIH